MSQSFTSDELIALAKFPFNDPRWKIKFLIGSLLFLFGYLILLPFIFVYGYIFRIMHHIIANRGEPYLPEWDDWGRLFTDGIKIWGVILLYNLPLLVLFCSGFDLIFGTIFISEAISNEAETPESLSLLLIFGGMIGGLVAFGLGIILSLVVGVVLPAATAHMITHNKFAAAFRFREWGAILKANVAGYLMAYALILGFWVVFSFAMQILYVTIIFCALVPFVMAFVGTHLMITGSILFAQAYQVGAEKLAASQ